MFRKLIGRPEKPSDKVEPTHYQKLYEAAENHYQELNKKWSKLAGEHAAWEDKYFLLAEKYQTALDEGRERVAIVKRITAEYTSLKEAYQAAADEADEEATVHLKTQHDLFEVQSLILRCAALLAPQKRTPAWSAARDTLLADINAWSDQPQMDEKKQEEKEDEAETPFLYQQKEEG